MGTRLVYTVSKTGDIEGLLKDEKLDTSAFGHRQIKRITEILHSDKAQAFYIRWLLGPYEGALHRGTHALSLGMLTEAEVAERQHNPHYPLYFNTYQQAVDHEIRCVNRLRELGHSFV